MTPELITVKGKKMKPIPIEELQFADLLCETFPINELKSMDLPAELHTLVQNYSDLEDLQSFNFSSEEIEKAIKNGTPCKERAVYIKYYEELYAKLAQKYAVSIGDVKLQLCHRRRKDIYNKFPHKEKFVIYDAYIAQILPLIKGDWDTFCTAHRNFYKEIAAKYGLIVPD